MKHTLVALMQDHPGVLTRAVSLFRRRGYNIESLVVGRSETPGISRMTLVVDAEDVEQVVKQLYRLIEVLKVSEVSGHPTVEREMALIKVNAPPGARAEILGLAHAFNARVVDVAAATVVVEITGSPEELDRFVEVVRPFGLREMTRTGRIAMVRGPTVHRADGNGSAEDATPARRLAAAG